MYRAVIAAAIAGFVLSGCASAPIQTSSEFVWSYGDAEGEGPKLAYGRPQSDEVLLMMTCSSASQVNLSAAAMNSPNLTLTSGETATTLHGQVAEGFEGDAALIEVATTAKAPALKAFRQSGALRMSGAGRNFDLTAGVADQAAIKRFFTACETA